MWKEILFKILDGEKNIPSPFAKDGIVESVFVVVQESSRMGFLLAWCSVTHRGVHISRMEIPENVKSISNDEFRKLKLPEIEFEDIS
jgi:hypothetical protein